MNLVDSSGWLAFFADEPNAKHFAIPLSHPEMLIVPTVVVYEVVKVILREAREDDAMKAIAAMKKGIIVPLGDELAINAAKISLESRLPMADSIIMATAQYFKAVIWTQDEDFKKFRTVKYFRK